MNPDSPILITGARGRLGAALRRRLVADGRTLHLLDEGFDIADGDALARVVQDAAPSAVVHLASINGTACDLDPERAEAVNVTATRILAEAAAASGTTRLVFTSSAAVYGFERDMALRESDAVQPASLYGESKARAEDALKEVSRTDPILQSIALRVFNLYGPGFDTSLISQLATATPDHPVVLFGLDTFVRDYVHVDDVVEAIVATLTAPALPAASPEVPHLRVNVASGEPLTNRAVVERLHARQGLSYLVEEARRSYSYANIDLAEEWLGYRPRRFVGDGIGTA